MYSELDVIRMLFNEIDTKFSIGCNQSDINKSCQDLVLKLCYTESGNRRYRQGFIDTLPAVRTEYMKRCSDRLTEFGYWYNGEFYSTHKNTNHKSTSILHNENYPMEFWDSLESGLFYKDSLKAYYKNYLAKQ